MRGAREAAGRVPRPARGRGHERGRPPSPAPLLSAGLEPDDPSAYDAAPIGAAEFASLLAPLAPFGPEGRVAVAVSGGPDSMALAFLLARWAAVPPVALVVDHGLRDGSAAEAGLAADRLSRIGCEATILTLSGLTGGGGQDRARVARHEALASACRDRLLLDLFLGHHRDDQAETRHVRRERGSGADGLAGMAAVSERDHVRLLRPLLPVRKRRLLATLHAHGLEAIDDPSNRDARFARGRLRAAFPGGVPEREGDGAGRAEREAEAAAFLARHVLLHEAGVALIDAARVPEAVLGVLLRSVGGRRHKPRGASLRRLAASLRPATLGGVRIARAPARLGAAYLLAREPSAMEASVEACPGALWDGRFRVRHEAAATAGTRLGPLGTDSGAGRSRAWPASVLATFPVLRSASGEIIDLLHLRPEGRARIPVVFSPPVPVLPPFFTIGRQPGVVSSSISVP